MTATLNQAMHTNLDTLDLAQMLQSYIHDLTEWIDAESPPWWTLSDRIEAGDMLSHAEELIGRAEEASILKDQIAVLGDDIADLKAGIKEMEADHEEHIADLQGIIDRLMVANQKGEE